MARMTTPSGGWDGKNKKMKEKERKIQGNDRRDSHKNKITKVLQK